MKREELTWARAGRTPPTKRKPRAKYYVPGQAAQSTRRFSRHFLGLGGVSLSRKAFLSPHLPSSEQEWLGAMASHHEGLDSSWPDGLKAKGCFS